MGKDGKKSYKSKNAELKVEKFANREQSELEGKRIGYLPLNLSDFIGHGLKTMTIKMDKEG